MNTHEKGYLNSPFIKFHLQFSKIKTDHRTKHLSKTKWTKHYVLTSLWVYVM